MNTHDREFPVDPHAIDEQRWQAQERARLSVGRADGDGHADAVELRIARALRNAPPVDLPADFATTVARSAAAQAVARAHVQAGEPAVPGQAAFEQRLLRGLVLVFALSAAVVVAWYGRGWVADLAAVLPGGRDAVGWTGLAAACVLANWGWGALRAQLQRGSGALA